MAPRRQAAAPLVARSARHPARADGALTLLDWAVSQQQASLLTYATDAHPVPVQLMGLYQTKGREADAAVVVLRSNDFYGTERSPFPVGSRLLYVVLTRARHKTLLLLFGDSLPALVAPLAHLASSRPYLSLAPGEGTSTLGALHHEASWSALGRQDG